MHENELFGDNKCIISTSYNYPNKSNNQSTTSLISRLCSAEPFIGKNSPNSERFSIRKKLSETLFSLKRPPTHTLSSSLIELAPSSSILQNATNSILDKFSAKKLLNNKCSSNESLNRDIPSSFLPNFQPTTNSSSVLDTSFIETSLNLKSSPSSTKQKQFPNSETSFLQHTPNNIECQCNILNKTEQRVDLAKVKNNFLSSFADQSSSINNHSTINISSPCSSSFVANISNSRGGGCSNFVGDNLLVNKVKLPSSGTIAIAEGAVSIGHEPSSANVQLPATSSSAASSASSSSTQGLKVSLGTKGHRPDDATRIFTSKLTPFESTEIYNYQRIYFVGSQAKKRQCVVGGSNNNNFDDENGSYVLVLHDHIAYRYEILKIIGKGSFGQVIKAFDHKYQQYVALKIVRNEKRFHRQAEEEVRILDHLKKQDVDGVFNVIHMLDHFTFRNHKCITFECLRFSLALVRKFAHSILQCLELLHLNRLIHCDLKPENVLLKTPNRSSIKVIDFGSSCFDDQRIYSYIQSRFYRAPEVILGAKYGMPIDMWSLGCILAELLTGYPLLPGEDEGDQLALIIELLGMPSSKLLEGGKRTKNFFTSKGHPRYCQVTQLMDGTTVLTGGRSKRGKLRGPPASRSMQNALKNQADELFLDFLKHCLDWDPDARLTPMQALKHPWLRRRLPRAPLGGNGGGIISGNGNGLDNSLTISSGILK
uniref:Dual specificity tyrosine-phosphorylation-regulated kinase mbk-2 n=1 Tax=Meloidogyne floridensis TaxID=298350 RepID=A0A915P6R6_9BILA